MIDLTNKKVLFIGIGFYDYDQLIVNKLKEINADVTYLRDYSKLLNFGIVQRFIKLLKLDIGKLHNKYLNKSYITLKEKDFDYIFVIKGDNLSTEFIYKLKKINQNAKTILYYWDSLNRISNADEMIPLFDSVFSFDRKDCLNNLTLQFRPLFFREKGKKEDAIKYDIIFIGWMHNNRDIILNNILEQCEKLNLRPFVYLFTGLLTYIKNLNTSNRKYLFIKPLNYQVVNQKIMQSRVVLDLPHTLQTGLTIRTIEALGNSKKLITTNSDIVNYDFYNPHNIYIIENKYSVIERSMFSTKYQKIPKNIYLKYTLDAWIMDIFELEKAIGDD